MLEIKVPRRSKTPQAGFFSSFFYFLINQIAQISPNNEKIKKIKFHGFGPDSVQKAAQKR